MKTWTLAGTLATALALAACGRTDTPPTAEVEREAPAVSQSEPRGESLGERAGDAVRDAGNAMERGADRAGDAINDAAITASINAELARDDQLSALGINVDTSNGRVTLKGAAPNAAARDRATELAKNVRGVSSVDNELRVESQEQARPGQ